jgi:hypothetical protein
MPDERLRMQDRQGVAIKLDEPPISVVMAVYNSAQTAPESIESILQQTFVDFEFIIVDDGSTDATGEILRDYAALDNRIRLYTQEKSGLIASLNRHCRLAKGRYIARMDADDISLPDRFEKQFRFLEAHPEIGVLGTRIQDIGSSKDSQGVLWPVPSDPDVVGWFLLFGNCIAHPSVMMRREVLERVGYYRPDALHIEDYDLWVRASEISRIANIAEVLVQYRLSEESVSKRHASAQQEKGIDLKCGLTSGLVRRSVDRGIVQALQQSGEGSPVRNTGSAVTAASFVFELYTAYVAKVRPARRARVEIAMDAIRRLWLLGFFSRKISVWMRSLRFFPTVLSVHGAKIAFSLGAWTLRYRGRVFMSRRR